jgi:predicted RNA-binding protein YlqC (UPF0109 family)
MVNPTFMEDLVKKLAQALVDHPERVLVNELAGQTVSVLEVQVAPEDIPKLIGRQGRNAEAVRTIISAAGQKLGKRFMVEIIE